MSEESSKLMQNLFKVMNAIRKNTGRHYHFEYSSQSRVLAVIKKHGSITQGELSEILDIRPSSTSELLNKLETKGLIERKPDEKDGRINRITLTDKGLEHVGPDRDEMRADLTENATRALSDEDLKTLNALLEKMLTGLKDEDDDDFDSPFDNRGFLQGFNHFRGGFGPHARGDHDGPMGRGPRGDKFFPFQ